MTGLVIRSKAACRYAPLSPCLEPSTVCIVPRQVFSAAKRWYLPLAEDPELLKVRCGYCRRDQLDSRRRQKAIVSPVLVGDGNQQSGNVRKFRDLFLRTMTASRSTGQRQRLSCSRHTELVVGQCSEGSTVKKSDSAIVSQQPAQTGSWIQSVNGRSAGAGRSPCVSSRHRTGQEAKSQRWYLKDVVTVPCWGSVESLV